VGSSTRPLDFQLTRTGYYSRSELLKLMSFIIIERFDCHLAIVDDGRGK
jgi:hypothetical protein